MSRWVRKAPETFSEAPGASESKSAPGPGGSSVKKPLAVPGWARLVPFFLSAFLFMSGLFALFAPLPLLLVAMGPSRLWVCAAVVTNGLIVGALGGDLSLAMYVVFVAALALSLPEFLRRKVRLERAALLTLASMAAVGLVLVLAYAQWKQVHPVREVQAQVGKMVDYLSTSLSPESREQWLGDREPAEWKRDFLIELPSAVAIFGLLLVWSNLILLLRLNPARIRERMGLDASFFRSWKAPEYLVWPTIAAGVFLILEAGVVSDVAINVFRFLMAVYAIQGLSILAFLFDVWGIRGFFRSLGYLIGIFLMLPLLLSLGFFDLWFDFRAKLRQS